MKSIYIERDNYLEITDLNEFNIKHILECGQIFRYKQAENGYKIYCKDMLIEVCCQKGGVKIFGKNLDFVKKYFDLQNNYANIKSDLLKSNLMKKAIDYGYGIRILNQDPFETLISFIISANNNIPRIKKIIEGICVRFGENKGDYYAFPTLDSLAHASVQDFRDLGCGYRSEYLVHTISTLLSGFDLDGLFYMDTLEARNKLMKLKGVGRKVADCVLLFAYHKTDVFPTDTWIVQLYKDLTSEDKPALFISNYFSKIFNVNSGYAQQYLFYEKMNNRGEKNG